MDIDRKGDIDCCEISRLFCAEEKLDVAWSGKSQLLVAIFVVILWFASWGIMKNREVVMEQTYVQFEREEQISGWETAVRVW